jgi:Ferritin-like domain
MLCMGMNTPLTRAQLLVRGGAAALAGGAALGPLAAEASAAPIPAGDLAYVRLLVGAELLASDFYEQAITASVASPAVAKYLERAHFNEQEHYASVAGIISGTGALPATAADIDFSYPAGTFESESSISKLALQLEDTILGAYLGALGGIQTQSLLTGLGQIAACEAQHVSYFSTQNGGKFFNLSFPPALTIGQASDALDAYTS